MTNMKKNPVFQRFIIWAAGITLIAALTAGHLMPDSDLLPKMEEALPQAQSFTKIASNPLTFEGTGPSQNGQLGKVGYVVIDQANAYGGPLTMVTGIDLEGNIVGTVIAEHKDTPTFIQMVMNHDFLNQFLGKKITDSLSINKDIDRVSGATFSSRGIARAIAKGSHAVAKNQFGMEFSEEVEPIKFGFKEVTIIVLLVLMLAGVKFRLKKLRWITLLGGLIFIGFKFNTPVSLGNIAGILMGYFPSVRENIIWYLLFIGIPVITFILGKNVYCFWLCPFGAAQEIAAKIGGGKFSCHKGIELKARKIKYVLAYVALLAALLLRSPGFASYEPFATLFALQGFGVQWFILPVVLFASLFITRFWCRYFCPVWVVNEITWKLSRYLKGWLKGVKPWKKEKLALEKSST